MRRGQIRPYPQEEDRKRHRGSDQYSNHRMDDIPHSPARARDVAPPRPRAGGAGPPRLEVHPPRVDPARTPPADAREWRVRPMGPRGPSLKSSASLGRGAGWNVRRSGMASLETLSKAWVSKWAFRLRAHRRPGVRERRRLAPPGTDGGFRQAGKGRDGSHLVVSPTRRNGSPGARRSHESPRKRRCPRAQSTGPDDLPLAPTAGRSGRPVIRRLGWAGPASAATRSTTPRSASS